jgi:hypothetical protein
MILAVRNAWPSAAPAARRVWPVALLVVCAAVFAWRTDAAIRAYEPITTWSFLRRPAELVAIVVVTFGGSVLLAWRVRPPARRVPVWRVGALSYNGLVTLMPAPRACRPSGRRNRLATPEPRLVHE